MSPPTYTSVVHCIDRPRGDAKFNSRQITLFWETPNFIAAKIYWFTVSTNCKRNFINRELELIPIRPSQKILQFFNNLRFRGGDLLFACLLLTLNSIEYNLLLTSNKRGLICYCPLPWERHKLITLTCLYAWHIVANEGRTWKKIYI